MSKISKTNADCAEAPIRVLTSVDQTVDDGKVLCVSVDRKLYFANADGTERVETVVQTFDLSIIPYDVALSLACQIITGFHRPERKQLMNWSKIKPIFAKCLRYFAEILIVIAAGLGVTSLATSCGSLTKASIRQIRPNSSVTVSITTNNPSDITINPDTDTNFQSMYRHVNTSTIRKVYNNDPRNVGEVVEGLGVDLKSAMDSLLHGSVPQLSAGVSPVYNGFLDPGDVGHLAVDDFELMSQGAALAPLKEEEKQSTLMGDFGLDKIVRPLLDYMGRIDTTSKKIKIMDIRLQSLLPKGATTSQPPGISGHLGKWANTSNGLSGALSSTGAGLGVAQGIYRLANTFLNNKNTPFPSGLSSEEKQDFVRQRQSNASKTASSASSSVLSILGSILSLALL